MGTANCGVVLFLQLFRRERAIRGQAKQIARRREAVRFRRRGFAVGPGLRFGLRLRLRLIVPRAEASAIVEVPLEFPEARKREAELLPVEAPLFLGFTPALKPQARLRLRLVPREFAQDAQRIQRKSDRTAEKTAGAVDGERQDIGDDVAKGIDGVRGALQQTFGKYRQTAKKPGEADIRQRPKRCVKERLNGQACS